jgi:hypothetical protein
MAAGKSPRLLLVLPYPAFSGSLTNTSFAIIAGHAPLLPSDYLKGLAPRVFFQLAAFVNPGSGKVVELAVGLQSNDSLHTDLLGNTAVRGVLDPAFGPTWTKQLSRMEEISTRLTREAILAPRLMGRVDSGAGNFACPTLLVLREG